MPQPKTKNKPAIVSGGLAIFFALLLAAVGYLLYLVNQNLQQVRSDVFNVKATVGEQQKNVDEIEASASVPTESAVIPEPSLYINRRLGLQFFIPASIDVKGGIIEDKDLLLFGPVEEITGVSLPKYSLRYYPAQTFDDYLNRIRFVGEDCDQPDACLLFDFEYSKIDSDRTAAIAKIVEPVNLPGLKAWRFALNDTCLIPTVIVFDEKNNRMLEFQEHCASDQNEKYKVIDSIVRTLILL
ncbi:TPA: hypothetical protein DF272_02275 [Candidatus Falkowbacteria bacterium]|nr:hypothetical protein [Candidatus Falkowbacteria bacterium]